MIMLDPDLTPTTRLYRYMTIESFISTLETKQIHLTKVISWEDKWEAILSRVPTVNEQGESWEPSYSSHQGLYGQCWSRLPESDAMWRIYSPFKTGMQIATSVKNFHLVGAEKWCLGNVVYFKSIGDLLEKKKSTWCPHFGYDDALYKRDAFAHEEEVRFLVHGDDLGHFELPKYVTLPVDLSSFIEGVTIDPRADDWFVDAITRYCERSDLAVRPVKSSLYESDPHLRVGLVRCNVPIGK